MYDKNIPSGGNSVVECLLAKEDVASSSLVSRSILNKELEVLLKGFFYCQFMNDKAELATMKSLRFSSLPLFAHAEFDE